MRVPKRDVNTNVEVTPSMKMIRTIANDHKKSLCSTFFFMRLINNNETKTGKLKKIYLTVVREKRCKTIANPNTINIYFKWVVLNFLAISRKQKKENKPKYINKKFANITID